LPTIGEPLYDGPALFQIFRRLLPSPFGGLVFGLDLFKSMSWRFSILLCIHPAGFYSGYFGGVLHQAPTSHDANHKAARKRPNGVAANSLRPPLNAIRSIKSERRRRQWKMIL
jgi:hypothetical protein